MTVRLIEGTPTRIDKVLKGGEVRSVFVRRAVEAELAKRERLLEKKRA
jgi:metal-responsive CopG/Arc/MetJ family transcriptional regulator